MRKWIKVILWVVGIVVGLMLILSMLAGPVATSYLNRHGKQLVGRCVQVDHIGVNLFTGGASVWNFRLMEEDDTTVFARFDTLDIRLRLLRLVSHTVDLRHLTLSGLQANLLQQGDRFNFSSIVDHFATDTPRDTTPSTWKIAMRDVCLLHASLLYRDLLGHKELGLEDINLRVPAFAIGADQQTEGGLTLNFSRGGILSIDADHDATLGRYRVSASLQSFDLANVQDLITDYINIDHLKGKLQACIEATGETAHLLKSRLSGNVRLTAAEVAGKDMEVMTIDTLSALLNVANLDAGSFDLGEVRLYGMKARYEQFADHNTLSDLVVRRTSDADSTSTTERRPMSVHVGNVTVRQCGLTYVDHTLPDLLEFAVSDIAVDADNISTSGMNSARLRAVLPGGGHLATRWQGMISDWKQFQEVALTIKGMDMRQLNPLVVAYTGREFEDGILGLTTRLRIDHSMLDNQNRIDIYKATVGHKRKRVEPRANIPLKTALYVLKDKDEKILIDLPVKGNVDSPEFSYMKVVWKTLGNLLVKVATSPARAVGNMLGFGGDDLEFIPIQQGQQSLTSEQYHTLSQLAEVARRDEMISITLTRCFDAPDSLTVEHLERQLKTYWQEQGLDAERLHIVTTPTSEPYHQQGYAIGSEVFVQED